MQKRRSDLEDPVQQQEVADSVSDLDKKWTVLHTTVKDYRDTLNKANQFHKLNEEIDAWQNQKRQYIDRLIETTTVVKETHEVETIIKQIIQNIDEAKNYGDNKIKQLSQLAVQVYGIVI